MRQLSKIVTLKDGNIVYTWYEIVSGKWVKVLEGEVVDSVYDFARVCTDKILAPFWMWMVIEEVYPHIMHEKAVETNQKFIERLLRTIP